jgi:predicted aspartyl protease
MIVLLYNRPLTRPDLANLQMDDAKIVPLVAREDGIMTTTVRLHGKLDLTMTVDTGAIGTIIPMEAADSLELKTNGVNRRAQTMMGPATIYELFMDRIDIGQVALGYRTIYCTDGMKGLNKTLGMDVLSGFRVLFDAAEKKLYLKPYASGDSTTTSKK